MSTKTVKKPETKPETKKRQIYKGEDVRADTFLNRQGVGAPIQFLATTTPMCRSEWGTVGGTQVDKGILMQGTPHWAGEKTMCLRYYPYTAKTKSFGARMDIGVGRDLSIRVLSGAMGREMREAYDRMIEEKLDEHLGHSMTIGSDPEIFVEKESRVVPAFLFLKDKAHADRTGGSAPYGNKPVYWDGFQAEFETAGVSCLAYQVDSVQYGLKKVLELARKHDKDAKLSIQTVMEIPTKMLQNGKEEHVGFGCMPSLNVYGLHGEKCPPRDLPVRFAGGHIHFGIGKQDNEMQISAMVKALDAALAVPCVSLFAKYDNPIRRKFYGLPGEYRLPPHGLEYRVLSNAWLSHPLIMNLVFDLGRKALMLGMNGHLRYWQGSEEETVEVVQHCQVDKAREIMERNKKTLLAMFRAAYGKNAQVERIYQIFLEGMESVIKDPSDIAGNWDLDRQWISHCDGTEKNWGRASAPILGGGKV